MKKLLKFIYKRYEKEFNDFLVEDFYERIPLKVQEPAIAILAEKQQRVQQWLRWQAFILQRRIAQNSKEVDVIFGMLLQVKILMKMVAIGDAPPEEAPDTISIAEVARREQARKLQEEHDKSIEGVAAFKKKKEPK